MSIRTKRVYDAVEEGDGTRILIMRKWPRGIGYKKNKIDLWYKDLGPPNQLLDKWNRQEITWEDYKKEYLAYIPKAAATITDIAKLNKNQTVTLLCKEQESDPHCHRHILKPLIENETWEKS